MAAIKATKEDRQELEGGMTHEFPKFREYGHIVMADYTRKPKRRIGLDALLAFLGVLVLVVLLAAGFGYGMSYLLRLTAGLAR